MILDAGSGEMSAHWVWVQREVSDTTRVCAYDRAGIGLERDGPATPGCRSRGRTLTQSRKRSDRLLKFRFMRSPQSSVERKSNLGESSAAPAAIMSTTGVVMPMTAVCANARIRITGVLAGSRAIIIASPRYRDVGHAEQQDHTAHERRASTYHERDACDQVPGSVVSDHPQAEGRQQRTATHQRDAHDQHEDVEYPRPQPPRHFLGTARHCVLLTCRPLGETAQENPCWYSNTCDTSWFGEDFRERRRETARKWCEQRFWRGFDRDTEDGMRSKAPLCAPQDYPAGPSGIFRAVSLSGSPNFALQEFCKLCAYGVLRSPRSPDPGAQVSGRALGGTMSGASGANTRRSEEA